MIDTKAVTAVRLGDDWHDGVTDFTFFGDGQSVSITQAGATWMEPNGCRISCPLPSILAVREGLPDRENTVPGTTEPTSRNEKLESAIAWLKRQLHDGLPRPTKYLHDQARNELLIKHETLDRAWIAIKARSIRVKGIWCWVLDAQNGSPIQAKKAGPRGNELIQVIDL
jgi:predicted ATPase